VLQLLLLVWERRHAAAAHTLRLLRRRLRRLRLPCLLFLLAPLLLLLLHVLLTQDVLMCIRQRWAQPIRRSARRRPRQTTPHVAR
jgi:hypothetical protein